MACIPLLINEQKHTEMLVMKLLQIGIIVVKVLNTII